MQALFTQPVKKLMITNNSPGEMSYLIASMEQISKEFPLERSVTPTDLAVVRPLMSLEWGQITSVYPPTYRFLSAPYLQPKTSREHLNRVGFD